MGHRAIAGLALLCALLFSAVMASSASAVTGTTAFTCAPQKAGVGFSDAHCTKASGSGTFGHVAIAENLATTIHGTNEKTSTNTLEHTPFVLKSNQPLIGETEITCTKVFAHGTQTNKVNATTKEHFIHGEKGEIHYTECAFAKPSFCKVVKGEITVKSVTATSEGQGKNILFKPEAGTTFVTINTENCLGVTKLNVEGSVKAQENGATLEFNHAKITEDKSLTLNGQAAGLQGKITVSQAAGTEASAKTGNPITSTEVAT
jgi:hypothetical protein